MSDAPSLATALNGLIGGTVLRGPACTVGIILDDLQQTDPDGHSALVNLLDRTQVSAGQIAEVLASGGKAVSSQTVRRHRLRLRSAGCACPKTSAVESAA